VILDVFSRYVVGWTVQHRESGEIAKDLIARDNPYSEAHFKTLKYRPGFPTRFDSIEHARSFCRSFSPGTTSSTATPRSGS